MDASENEDNDKTGGIGGCKMGEEHALVNSTSTLEETIDGCIAPKRVEDTDCEKERKEETERQLSLRAFRTFVAEEEEGKKGDSMKLFVSEEEKEWEGGSNWDCTSDSDSEPATFEDEPMGVEGE